MKRIGLVQRIGFVGWALVLAIPIAVSGLACAPPDSELKDAELFVRYCSECHGDDGRGAPHYEPEEGEVVDLTASPKLLRGDRPFARRRMLYGYGPMPAFEHEMEPQDFDRLLDFVMELARTDPAEGDPDGP